MCLAPKQEQQNRLSGTRVKIEFEKTKFGIHTGDWIIALKMGKLSDLEMTKLLKGLILFAAEFDEIATTTYESIGDGTNNNNASSSPDNSDDFVLVPNNLPIVDAQAYDRKYVQFRKNYLLPRMTMQIFLIFLCLRVDTTSNHPTLVHRVPARFRSRSPSPFHAKSHDFSRLQK